MVVADAQLCELLDPLRGIAPVRVVCSRPGCGNTVSWWGLPVRGEPQPFAVVMCEMAGGPFPFLNSGALNTEPETGYVYGIGPWSVEGARVVYADIGPRTKLEEKSEEPSNPRRIDPPYHFWSVAWLFTHANPRDAGLQGSGLRLTFHCDKCGNEQTLTNTTMLKRLVTALATSEHEIRL